MPKLTYQRFKQKMEALGIDLASTIDMVADGFYPLLKNVRNYRLGLRVRPGLIVVNAASIADPNIHSIRTLNNDLPSAAQSFARFLGAATVLYSDNAAHTAFTSRATGFSGKPLQFVPMRPNQSPEPYMYVGDGSKQIKAKVDGTVQNMGIAAPITAPAAQQSATSYKVIDSFEAVGAWAIGGTAGAISAPSRVATTISQIKYDAAAPNWATVQPAALDESIQPGMLLIVNAGGGTVETVLVESVSEAITNTTIGSIKYDAGTTGACTIQLVAPSATLQRDSLIRIDSGGAADEVVRVLSVTRGQNDIPSFRCVTGNAQVATRTITGVRSFRAYFASTHAAAETLASNNLQSTIAVGTGFTTLAGALDLSVVNSRPITDDDEIHISIRLDNPTLLTEGKILLDFDSATNDFTQNFFYKEFRANDLVPAIAGTITTLAAQQRILQRDQVERGISPTPAGVLRQLQRFATPLDAYNRAIDTAEGNFQDALDRLPVDEVLVPNQTTTGASQWTELRFKVRDLIRVGSDTSRGLHDVAAIRIQLLTTGSVVMDVDAWWIGGTYGPDTSQIGAPINYRYVYRNSVTGDTSHPSPPMRSGLTLQRQRVTGTVTASSDTQVDVIDIYRTGGALIGDNPWYYVMTVTNVAAAFTDDFADDIIQRNPLLNFDNFVPFRVLDIPRSGTCDTVGTEVTDLAGVGTFNTAWPAGTVILINDVPYTLYASPSSITRLSLNESAGTQTGVTWRILSPILVGQTLPALFGPLAAGFSPVLFACGSAQESGVVYWTQPGNPGSHSVTGRTEVTDPSEPLQNGVIYHNQVYVLSAEALYVGTPQVFSGFLTFDFQRVSGRSGAYSRYGITVGDYIYFVGKEGIYRSNGGSVESITDDKLYALFPHDGVAGQAVNGINPPDYSLPDQMRLEYGDGELWFDYVDTGGVRRTLIYFERSGGWFFDSYAPSVNIHYWEEGDAAPKVLVGGENGKVYVMSNSALNDDGTAIAAEVLTPAADMGDPRSRKLFGDYMLDLDTGATTVTVTTGFDNNTTTLTPVTVTGAAGRAQYVKDFDQDGVAGRNICFRIALTTTGASSFPTLYEWEPSFTPKAESILNRPSDVDDAGYPGAKHVRGIVIEADTFNAAKLLRVIYDNGVVGPTFTATHNGQLEKSYAFSTPFIATLISLQSTDGVSWIPYNWRWIYDEYPENVDLITSWMDDGVSGAKFLQGVEIEVDTGGAAVTVNVQRDGGTLVSALSVTASGRQTLAFAWSPVIATVMRLVPTTAIQIFSAKWVQVPYPELINLTPDWTDEGTAGDKHFRGMIVEYSSVAAVNVQVQVDGGTVQTTVALPDSSGQKRQQAFAFTEFIAREIRLVPQGNIRFFSVAYVADKYPELLAQTTAWTNLGQSGAKYVRGLVLNADTANVAVSIDIQGDEAAVGATISATHNGQSEKPYGFTPFIAHLLRLVPAAAARIFDARFIFDEYSELAAIYTPIDDNNYLGAKYVRGLRLEVDTANVAVTITILADGVAIAPTISATANGKRELFYSFSTPFIAYVLQLVPDGAIRWFKAEFIYDQYPDIDALITPWQDGGYPGVKRIQGMILDADTANVAVNVIVQGDGESNQVTVSATHNGRTELPYSFTTPFYAHSLRLKPSGNIRIFGVRFVYEPVPESVLNWITDDTSFGFEGWSFLRSIYVSHQSTAAITLTVYADNVATTYTIPSSAGENVKTYVPLQAKKAKLWSFSLVSASPFRLYALHSEVRGKQWGSDGAFAVLRPFGDVGGSSTDGARI